MENEAIDLAFTEMEYEEAWSAEVSLPPAAASSRAASATSISRKFGRVVCRKQRPAFEVQRKWMDGERRSILRWKT